MPLWAAPVAAFVVAAWLCRRFLDRRSLFHLLDHPNERSLHGAPVPRSGGLAIFAGIVVGGLCVAYPLLTNLPTEFWWVAGAVALLVAVGFVDDVRSVSAKVRFGVHLLVASVLVWNGLGLAMIAWPGGELAVPREIGVIVTLAISVWLVNLYNFMDGMDGLAGGMALFGFTTLALLGWVRGAPEFALVNLVIAAASAGFLVSNFPPAAIFMGDAGSSLLGYLVAAIGFWGDVSGRVPLWATLLLFSPFLVDATYTLLRRMIRRELWWRPHRTHIYQRLVQAGWGHRRTLQAAYALMAALALSTAAAVLFLPVAGQWSVLLFWLTAYAALIVTMERRLPLPAEGA